MVCNCDFVSPCHKELPCEVNFGHLNNILILMPRPPTHHKLTFSFTISVYICLYMWNVRFTRPQSGNKVDSFLCGCGARCISDAFRSAYRHGKTQNGCCRDHKSSRHHAFEQSLCAAAATRFHTHTTHAIHLARSVLFK